MTVDHQELVDALPPVSLLDHPNLASLDARGTIERLPSVFGIYYRGGQYWGGIRMEICFKVPISELEFFIEHMIPSSFSHSLDRGLTGLRLTCEFRGPSLGECEKKCFDALTSLEAGLGSYRRAKADLNHLDSLAEREYSGYLLGTRVRRLSFQGG